MADRVRPWLHALLRVPADPAVPQGSAGSVQVFRAGRNYYRWQFYGWAISHLSGALVILGFLFFIGRAWERLPIWGHFLFGTLGVLSVLLLLVGIPLSYLSLALQYELRWYIVTDRSLRVREGVWSVHELTMTYANIQEIRVTSGPLQKLLGLADVEVKAAGGGTAGPHGITGGHVAVFEGVDNANAIRDLLVERLREYRDLGLGGSDTGHSAVPHPDPDAEATAAREVLAEVRALRKVIAARNS